MKKTAPAASLSAKTPSSAMAPVKPGAKKRFALSSITLFKNIKLSPKILAVAAGTVVVGALAIILLSGGDKNNVASAVTTVITPNPSMLALMQPSPAPSPDPTPEPTINIFIPLTPGETSPGVLLMQSRLMELDYMEPDEPTELYGKMTSYALQLFQREHGLQVDGIAGETTLQLLYAQEAKPYVTQQGDRGADVKEYQTRLIELGYLKDEASGKFGDNTVKAVTSLQSRNGLKADGKIGAMTREMLYSEDVRSAPVPTPKTTKKPTASQKAVATKSAAPKKTPGKAVKAPDEKGVNAMIAFAKQHLGYPYQRAGKGPGQFDCSGFVYWCLKNSGVSIGYMTSAGWAKSSLPEIKKQSELQAGDILCFKGHVGIYMGGGQMIDASSNQGKVRIATISSAYWQKNWICGKRVF